MLSSIAALKPTPLPEKAWPQNTRNPFVAERVDWTSKVLNNAESDLDRVGDFVFTDTPPEMSSFIKGIASNLDFAVDEFQSLVPSERQTETLRQVTAGVAELSKLPGGKVHGGTAVDALGLQQDLAASDAVLQATHR